MEAIWENEMTGLTCHPGFNKMEKFIRKEKIRQTQVS